MPRVLVVELSYLLLRRSSEGKGREESVTAQGPGGHTYRLEVTPSCSDLGTGHFP